MSLPRLHNRVALITGSSSGLGRAIAHAFASAGAQVCCVDLYSSPRNATDPSTGKADSFHNRLPTSPSTLDELHALPGVGPERAIFVTADVTSEPDVAAAVQACVRRFGRLDIMVNNAGVSVESSHPAPRGVGETSVEEWEATMAVNARGVFLGCKHAVRQMLAQEPLLLPGGRGDRGWIVNTASVQGLVAYHGTPSYCAAKRAVVQLTKSVAVDYAPHRIHCNAICPGFLRTAMTQNLQNQPQLQAETDRAHHFGGMGTPEDVAKAALFLASDDAAWVTGVSLPVDGGYTAL